MSLEQQIFCLDARSTRGKNIADEFPQGPSTKIENFSAKNSFHFKHSNFEVTAPFEF